MRLGDAFRDPALDGPAAGARGARPRRLPGGRRLPDNRAAAFGNRAQSVCSPFDLREIIQSRGYIVTVRKTGRGGPRPGAGRPRGPSGEVRRNRVVLMLTDTELAKLQRWANERRLPFGTVAYEIVERALRRRK
jgi:hypothetical protein